MLIAGGGIGGLAVALALAKCGIRSRVLERKPVFGEAGAGIQIGPNGVASLRAIGVAASLAAKVGSPDEIRVFDGQRGSALAVLPLGDAINARFGAPYWTIHRADLHACLLSAAQREPAILIETGFQVDRLEAAPDGIRLISTEGKVATGTAVIGADGLWSKVRSYVADRVDMPYAGWSAYRTVIDGSEVPSAFQANAVGLWLAPRAHVVHYPVYGGSETAAVVILPQTASSEGWAKDADRDDLLGRVNHLSPEVVAFLAEGRGWKTWSLFNVPPLARWSNGSVTLLGDAAHPVLPFLASGGVLALEDAVALAACVAKQSEDVPAAFEAYAKLRMKRAAKVATGARRNGAVYHMSGPSAFARNLAMKAIPAPRLMSRYDWLYGWKPPVLG
ncbi:MAG: FAD-dependent monooxygenase [Hyphomicrobiaceae bacterium]